jgi:hypothetical protein
MPSTLEKFGKLLELVLKGKISGGFFNKCSNLQHSFITEKTKVPELVSWGERRRGKASLNDLTWVIGISPIESAAHVCLLYKV